MKIDLPKKELSRRRNFTVKISNHEESLLKMEAKRTGKTFAELIREGYLVKVRDF